MRAPPVRWPGPGLWSNGVSGPTALTGPDGLLKQLTKTVIETTLNQETTEHLGHDKHGQPVAGNVRNGTRAKTVLIKQG